MRQSTTASVTGASIQFRLATIVAVTCWCSVAPAAAQDHDVTALAKTAQNPVGDLFSFPTSTIAPLQTGSWAAGPGAVVMKMAGPCSTSK